MTINLRPLNITREYSGVKTQLLKLEKFGMFCVLQYHMTPNYYKHKILLPVSFSDAAVMDEKGLFDAFDDYFKRL